jgi:hypothetical protein
MVGCGIAFASSLALSVIFLVNYSQFATASSNSAIAVVIPSSVATLRDLALATAAMLSIGANAWYCIKTRPVRADKPDTSCYGLCRNCHPSEPLDQLGLIVMEDMRLGLNPDQDILGDDDEGEEHGCLSGKPLSAIWCLRTRCRKVTVSSIAAFSLVLIVLIGCGVVCLPGVYCPVDCIVSDWSSWSQCTKVCAGGIQTQTRIVLQPASGGGAVCPSLSRTQSCYAEVVCSFDCQLSDWSPWSTCSASCGGGTQTASRTIVTPPVNGGAACPPPTDLTKSQACNSQACPPHPCPCSQNPGCRAGCDNSHNSCLGPCAFLQV